ncbi:hypothetical protein COCVIDRAFT_103790 [Bipolaris victoriae FI3]|uniref:RRM domain-containing protein n=1 Tax=Bipolaris victoriae (strain FI3) TaxID=930091 RepID=W7EAV9_BIPV3|nr:hypothetical protein COCVIDRAFT_103790 [Bipolaris victoriae FI3]
MTLVAGTRVSNERLIFVKNVPSYVADDQVEELFSPYRPVSYKNIYKGSSITTIVVGFRTTSDAARAQRETDGKCLGSAIIRVEMYEQRRSIRYIRDHGYNSTPWDVEEDEGEEEYEEEPYEEVPPKEATAGFSPYYPAPVKLSSTAAQGTTWAHIASRQHTQGVTNAPAITKADSAPSPASTPIAISEPAAHDETSSDGAHEPESEHQVMRWSEILRWAEHSSGDGIQEMQSRPYVPIDTMVRIRQVHCRDCAFCKSMERVRNGRE